MKAQRTSDTKTGLTIGTVWRPFLLTPLPTSGGHAAATRGGSWGAVSTPFTGGAVPEAVLPMGPAESGEGAPQNPLRSGWLPPPLQEKKRFLAQNEDLIVIIIIIIIIDKLIKPVAVP